MSTQISINSLRNTISELNIRMQEIAVAELRGRRVPHKLRRSLMRKRDEAHKALRDLTKR